MKYFSFPNRDAVLLEAGMKFKILFHLLSFEKKLRITLKYLRTIVQCLGNPLGVRSWRQHSIKSFSKRRQWDACEHSHVHLTPWLQPQAPRSPKPAVYDPISNLFNLNYQVTLLLELSHFVLIIISFSWEFMLNI